MLDRPFWDIGFRPFFLLAAAFAALWVPLWVAMYWGQVPLNDYLLGYHWHMHEMLFGFAAAAVAGFLLTATRNWTKRPTASGGPLALLALLWVAGRVAVLAPGLIPRPLIAAVDLAFLPLVALAVARPIVRARNWRNIWFVPLLLTLAALNGLMHAKALGALAAWGLPGGLADAAPRMAVTVLLLFITLIGGRIVPGFTRNATPGLQIREAGWVDRAVFVPLVALVVLQGMADAERWAGGCALLAGALSLWRMRGWGGRHTLSRPILWVLHLGYAWIGLGLLLLGCAEALFDLNRTAATHALTVGAIGTFVLGMMTRVALGHTGRPIAARRAVVVAYSAVTAAAVLRVGASAMRVGWYKHSLLAAAVAWGLAFAVYLWVYVPILLSPRADGKRDWRKTPPKAVLPLAP